MNTAIKDLQPAAVWHYFGELMNIPRPSKHEEKVSAYLQEFGRQHGYETLVDEVGNVAMFRPAAPGFENAKGVVIVVGDLNTTSESGHLAPLEKNMYYARYDAPGLDRYTGTFNGFGHSCSLIDHIFYGGKAVSPVKYWVDRTDYGVPFLSDHYPVLFEFDYK